MFLRAIGIPVEFDAAILTAASNGLIGYGVNPDAPMTRIETAALIVNALKAVGIDQTMTLTEAATWLAPFDDLSGLSANERIALAICVKLGIFRGAGDSIMNPHDELQRSQMASLAVRLQDVILGI